MAIFYGNQDSRDRAEQKVRSALTNLSDDFSIFPNFRLPSGTCRDNPDPEIDFLIIHKSLGFLVLEVKGYDCLIKRRGNFLCKVNKTTDTCVNGEYFETIKSPSDQARNNMFGVERHIKSILSLDFNIPHSWALALPFMIENHDLFQPASDKQWFFREDIECRGVNTSKDSSSESFESLIISALKAENKNNNIISDSLFKDIIDKLSGGTTISYKTLSDSKIREIEASSTQKEIIRCVDRLAGNRQMAVTGPAGSGKTILAVEAARKLAAMGKKTAILCFNRPLGDFLQQQFEDSATIYAGNIHRMAYEFLHQAGLENETEKDFVKRTHGMKAHERGTYLTGHYSDMISRFMEFMDADEEHKFDALVIDEAQDFNEELVWLCRAMLKEKKGSTLYIFYDEMQQIAPSESCADELTTPELFQNIFDKCMFRFRLLENYRNSSAIGRFLNVVNSGKAGKTINSIEGEISFIPAKKSQIPKVTGRKIHEFIHQDGLNPSDFAIIRGHSNRRTIFSDENSKNLQNGHWNCTIGDFECTDNIHETEKILNININRYKGLERNTIILTDIDHWFKNSSDKRLITNLYVAFSRAILRIFVIATKPTINEIKKLVENIED